MNLAKSCLSDISPSQFWVISEPYPDLVKNLQEQVRLMGQFDRLNDRVPWLSNTDGASVSSANRKLKTSTMLQLIAQTSERNSSLSGQIQKIK